MLSTPLALNSDGRLLAGTGIAARFWPLMAGAVFAQLAKAGSAQITGIARNPAGKLLSLHRDPGKVFSVGPGTTGGHLRVALFDAQLFSQWGRLDW